MLFNDELMSRIRRMGRSPFENVQMRLQSHPLPDIPPQGSKESAQAQRAWKTILEGGTVGNILNVGLNQKVPLIQAVGPNEDAKVMAVTLVPPLGTFTGASTGTIHVGFESAFAIVQWGVGGGVAQIEVDYGRGGSFSLVASSVTVMAQREPDPRDVAPAATVQLGAALAKYPIASPMKMTRTLTAPANFGAGVAPGAGVTVQIPQFAKAVTCYSIDPGGVVAGNLAMNVAIFSFASFQQASINLGFNQNPTPIPFMNQASFLFVTNNDPARNASFSFVFDLAL